MSKLKLMYITNNQAIAKNAAAAGIDRIFIDTERLYKNERQKGTNSFLSSHNLFDISGVKEAVSKFNTEILVRLNPINEKSDLEIELALKQGADILMLPMFKEAGEVKKFVALVRKRAKINLLLETTQALTRLNDILSIQGINEVHIGLNDLHLSMGLNFMFELLSGGIVEYIGEKCKKNNLLWGFGGIARIGEGILPAEAIVAEHVRLQSNMVILSRTFAHSTSSERALNYKELKSEVDKIRICEKQCSQYSEEYFQKNTQFVAERVNEIVSGVQTTNILP